MLTRVSAHPVGSAGLLTVIIQSPNLGIPLGTSEGQAAITGTSTVRSVAWFLLQRTLPTTAGTRTVISSLTNILVMFTCRLKPLLSLNMALSQKGMMKIATILVTTVRKSARASLPLQDRTSEMPTPSVVGTTQKRVSPAVAHANTVCA